MVAYLNGVQGVASSNLATPTRQRQVGSPTCLAFCPFGLTHKTQEMSANAWKEWSPGGHFLGEGGQEGGQESPELIKNSENALKHTKKFRAKIWQLFTKLEMVVFRNADRKKIDFDGF